MADLCRGLSDALVPTVWALLIAVTALAAYQLLRRQADVFAR